jgi:hypothetical protein
METATIKAKTKPSKRRLVIYIEPSLRKWLRDQRSETDRSVSEIAEELIELGRNAAPSVAVPLR